MKPTRYHLTEAAPQIRAESDLPPGIAGRVSGVALTYEVVDSYQTMFARKSAKRSIDNKVAARKVPLLMDHERTSKAHVGVVTEMQDVGDALVMTADIFDFLTDIVQELAVLLYQITPIANLNADGCLVKFDEWQPFEVSRFQTQVECPMFR